VVQKIDPLYIKVTLNPLPTNDAYMHHETFSFMMSYPAISSRDRAQKAWLCLGLVVKGPWFRDGLVISLVLSVNRPRKQFSHLV